MGNWHGGVGARLNAVLGTLTTRRFPWPTCQKPLSMFGSAVCSVLNILFGYACVEFNPVFVPLLRFLVLRGPPQQDSNIADQSSALRP